MRRLLPALLLALAGCLNSGSSFSGIGSEAAPLALPDLAGKTVRLSEFRGKVVLLDFWATWCPPCIEEVPDLLNLQRAYQKDGFTVVGPGTVPSDAVNIEINQDGELIVSISGQVAPTNVGQIQLANFANEAGLEAIGDNLFKETPASGAASFNEKETSALQVFIRF